MKIPTKESIKRIIRMQRSGNNLIKPTDTNDLVFDGMLFYFVIFLSAVINRRHKSKTA